MKILTRINIRMVLPNFINQNLLNKKNELLIEVIQKYKLNLNAIILYGSYGRGEGAYFTRYGEVYLYNDLDLFLVTEKTLNQRLLNQIKSKLKEKINIQWIDISQISKAKLTKLKPSIFNYDLKYGSKIIWGDKEILNLIPEIKSSDITLKDAEVLYFTRLWTFLGSLDEVGFMNDRKGEEVRFFRYQMAKAVLAIVDILLLQKGEYHQSYNMRVQKFEKLYSSKIQIIELSKWALNEKLNPSDIAMTSKEIKKIYESVLEKFMQEMFIVLTKYYGRNIKNTKDIERALFFSYSEFVIRLKSLIITRSFQYQKQKMINLAQSYLVEAYFCNSVLKQMYMEKVVRLIQKVFPNTTIDKNDWDKVRVLLSQLKKKI